MPQAPAFHIRYAFYLQSGETLQFELELQPPSLALAAAPRAEYPEWTQLGFQQCPHCPLKAATHPRCPVAANLIDVVETFREGVASDEAEIIVQTDHRSYGRRGPLAQGISAMIGLIMATSGCPYMDKLRPMAYTHLPFGTKQETIFRALSMYLLGQFFVQRRGGEPDWSLGRLVQLYDDINVVNEHLAARLKTVCHKDASLNALTKLDCFASITAISVESNSLDEIENLFQAYYGSGGGARQPGTGKPALTLRRNAPPPAPSDAPGGDEEAIDLEDSEEET
jgi:hypothetical protein